MKKSHGSPYRGRAVEFRETRFSLDASRRTFARTRVFVVTSTSLSSADSSNIPGRTCFVICLYREICRKMISLVKIILSIDTRVTRIRGFLFLQIFAEDLIQNNRHYSYNLKYISIFNFYSK